MFYLFIRDVSIQARQLSKLTLFYLFSAYFWTFFTPFSGNFFRPLKVLSLTSLIYLFHFFIYFFSLNKGHKVLKYMYHVSMISSFNQIAAPFSLFGSILNDLINRRSRFVLFYNDFDANNEMMPNNE